MDLESVNALLTQGVPFNRLIDLRVVAVEPERAEVAIEDAPERQNHVGTVHAAVEFALGDAASGAMVVSTFADLQTQGYVPLVASARIAYLKPGRGELHGVASLNAETQQLVRQEVQTNGKARFSVPIEIRDAGGTLVAEVVFEWALIKPRS